MLVPMADVTARLDERDRLMAMDDRNSCQRFLGDPPSWRSALASPCEKRPFTARAINSPTRLQIMEFLKTGSFS
jgi:hypothetical protein